MPSPTPTDRLIQALETLPPSFEREDLLKRTRAQEFHDFRGPATFPKVVLVEALSEIPGPEALAVLDRAMNGEFDDEMTAEDYDDLERSLSAQDKHLLAMIPRPA